METDMGIEDLAKQAQSFLGSDQVKDALKSSKAEDVSDSILDKLEGAVDGATGGKFSDQIGSARDAADKAVGDNNK
jgi:uncharacterized protein YjbJ (UPF0337 family)